DRSTRPQKSPARKLAGLFLSVDTHPQTTREVVKSWGGSGECSARTSETHWFSCRRVSAAAHNRPCLHRRTKTGRGCMRFDESCATSADPTHSYAHTCPSYQKLKRRAAASSRTWWGGGSPICGSTTDACAGQSICEWFRRSPGNLFRARAAAPSTCCFVPTLGR